MYNEEIINEINRLNFEDLLWIIFIILALINIYGDYNEKEFLKTNDNTFKYKSNRAFETTIFITIIIYIYFIVRNYFAYKKAPENKKYLYKIKLLGSAFLIAGAICLLYFQRNESSFTGTPAL